MEERLATNGASTTTLDERPLSVAFLDDDLERAERLRDQLRSDGISVSVRPTEDVLRDHVAEVDAVVVFPPQGDGKGRPSIRDLASKFGATPVVLVSSGASRREQRTAMDEGLAALVREKDLDVALAPTIRAVCAGQIVVPRSLRWQFETPALSQREKQVLGLVVLGYTNGEIASKLYLAESTVKSHLSSSFGKLGVRSRREAADIIVDADNGLGTGILAISGADVR